MKRQSSYTVALAGVSCALAVLSVIAGAYLPTAKIAMYALSAFCVAIPLTQNMFGGAVFTYIGAAVLTGLICNIKCLPFALFFGPYALVAWALDFKFYQTCKWPKAIKIVVIALVKLAFFAAAFFACVALMKIVVADLELFGVRWTMPLFALAGWVAFSLFDVVYRVVYGQMRRFVARFLSKGGRADRARKGNRPIEGDDAARANRDETRLNAPQGGAQTQGDAHDRKDADAPKATEQSDGKSDETDEKKPPDDDFFG